MAGLLGASAAYLLEARFYKWYIWLFPLGTLWLLDRVSGSQPKPHSEGSQQPDSGSGWAGCFAGTWEQPVRSPALIYLLLIGRRT